MPKYTTTEAAALLQTARRNVQNYARRYGLKKFGREYVVTAEDLEGMRAELGKPGPKKNRFRNTQRNTETTERQDKDTNIPD